MSPKQCLLQKYIGFWYITVAGICDLSVKKNFFSAKAKPTETQNVIWVNLTDSEKEKVVKQAKTYLLHQIEEAKRCRVVLAVLDKHGISL